ncbi:MAG: DNA-3-methyladenine glycosylase [Marinilabiliales bacterium]|mgnify:CR=1 FL=1|nr:MAG: DNA-3-methyladenine glycosylase [Marinilabiliales bacterium]
MLQPDFYTRPDVLQIARDLLGKVLVVEVDGQRCSGIITETEAYAGINDKASHAYGGRRTARTETMYMEGGCAYVYLCYGIHNLFNVVTNTKEVPHAVLIRAIKPLENTEIMIKRAANKRMKGDGIGPGKLCAMLGITREHNAVHLQSEKLHIADYGIEISNSALLSGKRIGIDYAEEDAELPYRFWVKHKDIEYGS